MPEESKKKTHKSLSLTLAVHQRVMARAEATGLTPETVLVTLMDVVDEPAFRRAVAARLVAGLDRPAAAPASQPRSREVGQRAEISRG